MKYFGGQHNFLLDFYFISNTDVGIENIKYTITLPGFCLVAVGLIELRACLHIGLISLC